MFRVGISKFLLPVAMFIHGGLAGADTYTTSINYYPPVEGMDCDVHAASLGATFEQTYNVRVIEAICNWESTTNRYWSTRIVYEAPERLTMVSTAETASGLADGGTYKTSEECRAALDAEKEFFVQKTGLSPFVEYCQVPMFEGREWALSLVAYGNSDIRPFVAAGNYFGKIVGMNAAEFESMLRHGLQANGAELVQWLVQPSLGYGLLKLRYYGPKAIRFSESDFAKMRTAEECLVQREEMVTGLAAWSGATLGSYCHEGFAGTSFEMVSLTLNDHELRTIKPSAAYPDFNACTDAKGEVIERYRGSLQRQILVGLCAWNAPTRSYGIVLIERPKI